MPRLRAPQIHKGFTLVELVLAVAIVALVFASAMTLMGRGFQVLDDARLDTLASQVLQSEMEDLRLKNWSEITALLSSEDFTPDNGFATTSFSRFTCTRTVETVVDNDHLRKITLVATWHTTSGRARECRYLTFIGEEGLNDYYYRSF